MYDGSVMASYEGLYSFPLKRLENWRDVIASARPGDEPGGKVQAPLDAIQAAARGAAPSGQAVGYVWEDVGMDKEFEDIRSEVMADFVERCYDGIASSHHNGHLGIPAQVLVEEYSQHLDGRRWCDGGPGDFDAKTSCK